MATVFDLLQVDPDDPAALDECAKRLWADCHQMRREIGDLIRQGCEEYIVNDLRSHRQATLEHLRACRDRIAVLRSKHSEALRAWNAGEPIRAAEAANE